jgi:hypothetical protein
MLTILEVEAMDTRAATIGLLAQQLLTELLKELPFALVAR